MLAASKGTYGYTAMCLVSRSICIRTDAVTNDGNKWKALLIVSQLWVVSLSPSLSSRVSKCQLSIRCGLFQYRPPPPKKEVPKAELWSSCGHLHPCGGRGDLGLLTQYHGKLISIAIITTPHRVGWGRR